MAADNKKNNSSNSLVFGRWPQTKKKEKLLKQLNRDKGLIELVWSWELTSTRHRACSSIWLYPQSNVGKIYLGPRVQTHHLVPNLGDILGVGIIKKVIGNMQIISKVGYSSTKKIPIEISPNGESPIWKKTKKPLQCDRSLKLVWLLI